jgi:predicted nucleic acid-binding protein
MRTIIDANVLVALFKRNTSDNERVRVDGLLESTKASRGRILIPTPALSEFAAKAKQDELDFLFGHKIFLIAPFDSKAAIECGEMLRVWANGLKTDKKDRHKAKFDMQILAIAKSEGVDRFVTGDKDLRTKAARENIKAIGILDLPIPDSAKQHKIPFS